MQRFASLSVLLPLLAFAALVCAVIGWTSRGLPMDAVIFKSIQVLGAGSDYADTKAWRPNAWLEAARWIGQTFFVLTAYKAFALLVSDRLAHVVAQFVRRDVVLIGDAGELAKLAERLAARGARVVWLHPDRIVPVRGVRVARAPADARTIRQFRVRRARLCVIAFERDDSAALAAARHVLRAASAASSRGPAPRIVLLAGSAAAAAVLDKAVRDDPVQIALPVRAGIRAVHAVCPPFLVAHRAGHDRLHALLVGCGDAGEQIIADILLSSRTGFLGTPILTIIDPRAHEIEASFASRFPELHLSAELQWIEAPGREDARALPGEKLVTATRDHPISVAYVALGDDQRSLAAAVTLMAYTAQLGLLPPMVFVRQRHALLLDQGLVQEGEGVTAFGTADQVIDGLQLLDRDPDRLPRLLHERYTQAQPAGAPAVRAWDALPESLREANRSVLAHNQAKLASVAVEQGRDPAVADHAAFAAALQVPPLAERLAGLEHERWSVERRLTGWRHAEQRDDVRRLHPDLVAYAELSERSRAFDRLVVRTIGEVLTDRAGA